MANMRAHIFMGFSCFFLLSIGMSASLAAPSIKFAAPSIKFSPVGNWEVLVKENFSEDRDEHNPEVLDRERTRISITPYGENFSLKFVSLETYPGAGGIFPKTLNDVRLKGNTITVERDIDSVKHKLILKFDKSNFKLKGTFTTNSWALILPVENVYEVAGHLSHRDMFSLLRLNRQVFAHSCKNQKSGLLRWANKQIADVDWSLGTCIRKHNKQGSRIENLSGKILSLESQKEANSSEITSLKSQRKSLSKQRDQLVGDRTDLETSNKNLNQKNKKLQSENKNVKKRVVSLSETVRIIEEDKESIVKLKQKNQELMDNTIKLENVVSKQTKKILTFQKYQKNLKKALKELSRLLKEEKKRNP